ncbi:OmpW/AlkL family protein [Acinetobacter larvae]|uniref:OmpW family protein n=1 Tax=Acinetobacter larvae TaxID=1789224 RepID=A0A1B2LXF3_9GAMM|nr:OmpW family outer membrane protein [Acinetobacter larvae]AOA57610.1 hypothetical protein BFG52_04065 [Acinetobacter larvae]
MNNKTIILGLAVVTSPINSYAESDDFKISQAHTFKRFSISAGWLHAAPLGQANPFHIATGALNGDYRVGTIKLDTVNDAVAATSAGEAAQKRLNTVASAGEFIGIIQDGTLTPEMSGRVNVQGIEQWQNANTGLEANAVDTLGIMANYYFTDHWSLELKAGIPPKVDISGKGQIFAPFTGVATPEGNLPSGIINNIANQLIDGIGPIPLDKPIAITDLAQGDQAASVRAWLPAAEIHYQFGRSGINKFRPYVGIGVMYAYFDKVQLNPAIESDLISAGHKVQNILDNQAGAALEGSLSSADPEVKVKTSDAFAPIVTLGASYDFNPRWFAVASLSYAKLNNEADIRVTDRQSGKTLIQSKTKIDIDPIITYLGLGYRF